MPGVNLVKPCAWAVLLVLLVGCGTATHAVRLDTGRGKLLVHVPRGGQEPVKLHEGGFKKTLAELARDVRPASNPLQNARRLMFDSPWQEEVYLKWTGRQLVLDSEAVEALHALQVSQELTRDYGRWCEHEGRHRDCLSLLGNGAVLTDDGRYALAMEFALGSVWNEAMDAFKGMADPEAVRATIVSAMAIYMTLWLLPEPASKGLTAILTASLIAYLGVDTVLSLIQGWRQLDEEVKRASSFAELREAGERFGRVMGQNAARIFVMLATAAIGNTAGLATKGPGLPGYSRAAVLSETQGGFRLAAMAEVQSVAVSAEGFTIALAPGAVAMSTRGMGHSGEQIRQVDAEPTQGSSTTGAVNVQPPAARHYARRVDQGTLAKDVNSVIEPRVDVNADMAAIKSGRAQVGRTPGGEVSYTVNGRTYGAHPNGTLYPMQGDGIHVLRRGAFKALGVYNRFGDTPRAVQILDSMGIGMNERAQALGVWRAYQ